MKPKEGTEVEKKCKPKLVLGRPADKSLQAFKDFILGFCKELGVPDSNNMTEEEWEKGWKKFWSKK